MLFPDPRRRGEVQFLLAKSLPYQNRLWLILSLLGAGILVQVFLDVWFGAAFILAASLLAVVRGFSNLPDIQDQRREWRGAEREQLERILSLARRARKWDQSLLDVTCWTGLALFVLVIGGIVGIAAVLWTTGDRWLAEVWVADSVALLIPHWVTGVRRILTNDPLQIQVRQLLAVWDFWESIRREDEVMLPQMEVIAGEKGELPTDVKLVLRLGALGDAFLGVQVQVVLNRVQGTDYPYLYCVLVARPELGMLERLDPSPPGSIVVEPKRQGDVEILVIRNRTTKQSGYHTKPRVCRAIFEFSLGEARKLAEPAE